MQQNLELSLCKILLRLNKLDFMSWGGEFFLAKREVTQ